MYMPSDVCIINVYGPQQNSFNGENQPGYLVERGMELIIPNKKCSIRGLFKIKFWWKSVREGSEWQHSPYREPYKT